MAPKSTPQKPARPEVGEVLENVETPKLNWKVIGQIAVGFAVLWVLAFMAQPLVGWWGVGIAGVLTLVALGFGLYVWNLTRKSQNIVEILKTAKDAESRKAALEQLKAQAGGEGKDALNALAQAQLVAQDDPESAMRILEGIDLKKAPSVIQDDVRANLALMYLVNGRVKDARPLVDEITLERQPQAKARAMYAAVMAETFSRTGKHDEALKLLETYKADDPENAEIRPLLLRATVYGSMAAKKRGLARTAMEKLAAIDPNMLAPFVQRGVNPELQQLAKQVLQTTGLLKQPRPRMR